MDADDLIRSRPRFAETRRASPTLYRRWPCLPAQGHRLKQEDPRRGGQRAHARPRLRDLSLRHFLCHLDRGCLYRLGNPADHHQKGHRGRQGLYDQGRGWTFPYGTAERESEGEHRRPDRNALADYRSLSSLHAPVGHWHPAPRGRRRMGRDHGSKTSMRMARPRRHALLDHDQRVHLAQPDQARRARWIQGDQGRHQVQARWERGRRLPR